MYGVLLKSGPGTGERGPRTGNGERGNGDREPEKGYRGPGKCLRLGIHGPMDFSIVRGKGGVAGFRRGRVPLPLYFFRFFFFNFETNRLQ